MKNEKGLKPVCAVVGKSAFLRREAVDRVIARELDGGDPAINLRRFSGEDASLSEVLDDVRTYSLLGGRRVAIVDEGDEFITKHREALERFVVSGQTTGCLVLLCDSLNAGWKITKAIAKVGEIIECKPAAGQALEGWLVSRAQSMYGKRLGHQAAARLREHAGNSQEGLDGELCKLSLFVGQRAEITAADVDALVGDYREQTVFAVMDAVADGDVRRALKEWDRVVSTDPAAGGRAIGGLAYSVRRLLEGRKRYDEGTPARAMANSYFIDPATLERRLKRTSVRRCEDQLADLAAADRASKTGLMSFERAVELFIVKHGLAAAS